MQRELRALVLVMDKIMITMPKASEIWRTAVCDAINQLIESELREKCWLTLFRIQETIWVAVPDSACCMMTATESVRHDASSCPDPRLRYEGTVP